MKKLLLSFLVLLPFAISAMEEKQPVQSISLYKSGWDFLEEKFVKQPQENFTWSFPKIRRAGSIIAAFIAPVYVLKKTFDNIRYDNPHRGLISFVAAVSSLGILEFICNKGCSTFNYYWFNYVEKKNAMEFIANWGRNKKHSPAEVIEFFDDIYADYQKNPNAVKAELPQIIKAVKSEIEKHSKK